MSTKTTFVFKDADVVETMSTIHDKYVVDPEDKAANNIVLICTKHSIDIISLR